jgi:uncharacterized membrane protein YbhN (UPF0104 family)
MDPVAAPSASLRGTRLMHRLLPLISLVLFAAAAILLYRELREHTMAQMLAALRAVPPRRIGLALGLTVLSFAALAAYDGLAMRYIHHPMPLRRVIAAAFIGYGFSNSLGHPIISGGSLRYRLYAAWGLRPGEVTRVIIFGQVSFKIGAVAMAAAALLTRPAEVARLTGLPATAAQPIGAALAFAAALYFTWTLRRRDPIRVRSLVFPMPGAGITIGQLAVALVDVLLTGAVLYVLLPHQSSVTYAAFIVAFLTAILAGYWSLIPAGLGVFEMVMLAFLTPELDEPSVFGTLLVYRVVYFLLPLILAACGLLVFELSTRPRRDPETRLTGE